ncbi:MarR family winged helix-turn-helix transcriptional regulator [Streptosporangium sp. NPDC020072]|uniref:MarR family winged helix-turn-helix transcriptional regulator n=1 Tax=Streptosporangium sp. NPDC020072 TaxID=3154788 RepID=UPI00342037B6
MSETSRPAPPVTNVSIVVLTLAHQVEAELNRALAPLDLTVSRLGLLAHIKAVPGVSFSDLARMSGITVQSVHTAVKTLERAGLVRDSSARAGSASVIEVTAEGARLLRAAQEAADQVDEHLFGPDSDPTRRRVGETIRAAFRTAG